MIDVLRKAGATAVTVALAAIVIWGIAVGEPSDRSRVESLGAQIKCPVCNGETIIDSPAGFAVDMLDFVDEKVNEGWTDEEILSYFESRYPGTRLDTGLRGSGALLWALPLAVAVAGIVVVVGMRRGGPGSGGNAGARSRTIRDRTEGSMDPAGDTP